MIVYPLLIMLHVVCIPLGIVLMALPTARRVLPRGRCAGYGYDLFGLPSGRYPECGFINSDEEIVRTPWTSHLRFGIGVGCVVLPLLFDAFIVFVIAMML